MTPFLTHFSEGLALIEPTALARLAIADPMRIRAAEAYAQELGKIHASGDKAAEGEWEKRVRAALAPKVEMTDDGIAIVPVEGPLAYAPDIIDMLYYGVEDSRAVERAIRNAATSPDARAVAIRIHSPGGQVMGGAEVAAAVEMSSARKPTAAHTGGVMASLAYWIGSQATAGVYATSAAYVGSIGVISTFTDISKYLENLGVKVEVFTNKEAKFKALGVPGTSLTADGRDHMQERAQSIFKQFRSSVLAARPDVPNDSMQGQVFVGKEALKAGLVDGVASFDFTLAVLRNEMRKRRT